MIKKFILGLFISVIGFLGFSNAGRLQVVGLQDAESIYNNNYMITFIKGGGILSNFLGTTKSVLAFDTNKLFWRTPNGLPYVYTPNFQGYFTNFYSCRELTTEVTTPANCTSIPIDSGTPELLKNFFTNVVAGDYGYYNYLYEHGGSTCGYLRHELQVCFSSSSLHQSLCFAYGGGCSNGCAGSSSYCNGYFGGSLGSSNNYTNLTFSNIPYSEISYAPGQAGYQGGGNIEGSSSVGTNTTLSGNLMYNSCTNGYIISRVSSLYGGVENVCYAGTNDTHLISGGVTLVPVSTGLNFKEVYNGTSDGTYGYFSSYSNWFNTRADNMYRWKMGTVGFEVFNGVPTYLYSYFNRLYNNGLIYPGQNESFAIANFCKLALFSNYFEEYKGSYFSSYCDDLNHSSNNGNSNDNNGVSNGGSSNITTGEVGSIDNDNQEVLPPGYNVGGGSNQGSNTSNGTIVSVDWSGTLSGDTNKNFEGKTFINDFYQKLQANFQKPYNGIVGIIPSYILVFMFALILFRFLSH